MPAVIEHDTKVVATSPTPIPPRAEGLADLVYLSANNRISETELWKQYDAIWAHSQRQTLMRRVVAALFPSLTF